MTTDEKPRYVTYSPVTNTHRAEDERDLKLVWFINNILGKKVHITQGAFSMYAKLEEGYCYGDKITTQLFRADVIKKSGKYNVVASSSASFSFASIYSVIIGENYISIHLR